MIVQTRTFGLLDYYFTSIGVGLKSVLGRYSREAAARIANPLSYPRYMEYQLTIGALGPTLAKNMSGIASNGSAVHECEKLDSAMRKARTLAA